jgi:hypothetical protein
MNRRAVLIGVGLIGLIALVAIGWYLASPLFIDQTVDEAFPFKIPDTTNMEEMSDAEMKALESEFMAAVPNEEILADLSVEEMEEVTDRVMEAAAAVMADTMMKEPMPEAPAAWSVVAQGQFIGADSFHVGSGSATILQQDENRVLRLEEFSVTNGPDLHVILTRHPAPNSRSDVGEDYVDLGELKGNQGNQNYDIPAGVDLSIYQSTVIYCVPFHVVFATAALSGSAN